MEILKKPITMDELRNKYESFKTTADIPLFEISGSAQNLRIVHEFKKLPNGVDMKMRWIVDGKEYTKKSDEDFISYENALRIINRIMKSDSTVEAVEAKSLKGFKTSTYGKKGHRDNITQLENSVRKMW